MHSSESMDAENPESPRKANYVTDDAMQGTHEIWSAVSTKLNVDENHYNQPSLYQVRSRAGQ